jgi:coenzyme Q-binding protein COQ10
MRVGCRWGELRNSYSSEDTVTVEVVTRAQEVDAPIADVWRALQDYSALTRSVPDVRRVEVQPQTADLRVVSWSVWLKGFELGWKEEQRIDHANRRLEFAQSEGMFAVYRGSWSVVASGVRTSAKLHLEVDTGMPYLASLINPIIARAFAGLMREVLDGLLKKVSVDRSFSSAVVV